MNTTGHPPFFLSSIPAGFPSPADDFLEKPLDLNEHLIRRPASTFFVRVQGESMTGAGLFPGSILIVDRSVKPRQDSIVVAILDGEFTVKRIRREAGQFILYPDNPQFQPIMIKSGQEFAVWGVVIHAIRSFS